MNRTPCLRARRVVLPILPVWGALASLFGCTGVSLGPNEGASFQGQTLSRRAGMVLEQAPKVTVSASGRHVVEDAEVYIVAPVGDDKAPAIAQYLTAWAQHPVFSQQVAEYGVHPLQVRGVLDSTYAWPSFSFDGGSFVSGITTSNVEAAIAEALSARPELTVSANTVFVVVVPDGVSVSLGGDDTQDACEQGVLSWHAATRVASSERPVPYVALGACGGRVGLSESDTLGMALSHSMLNALTNPLGQGVHGVTGEASAWSLLPGAQEVASLCGWAMAKSPQVLAHVDGIPWAIHRSWSNERSLMGMSPCAPALLPQDDYTVALAQGLVLVPVSLPPDGTGADLPGIAMAAGRSTQVSVQAVGASSEREADFITLAAEALDTTELDVSVSPSSIAPGAFADLTVTLSPNAKRAHYLVRLTSKRHDTAFSQYVLIKRTP